MKNILLIEDDRSLSNGVRLALQSEEYNVLQCFGLKETRKADISDIALIILDINLPDGSGLDFFDGT